MAANPALAYIDARLTELVDQRKQAVAWFEAASKDHARKLAELDAEAAAWWELDPRVPEAAKSAPAAKKVTKK